MERRRFLQLLSAAGMLPAAGCMPPMVSTPGAGIDRQALVKRHAPVVRAIDPFSVLSVGNGSFAFTADVTGMQTFPDAYGDIPLATQSEWGWHSFPNPEGYALDQAVTTYQTPAGPVPYADLQHTPAGAWLRQNPHRLSLARIGFDLRDDDDQPVRADGIEDVEQRLDLWSGTLSSRFRRDGTRFQVTTCADPGRDLLAFRILFDGGNDRRPGIRIAFPYGAPVHTGEPGVWSEPERHRTTLSQESSDGVQFERALDADRYHVRARWSPGAALRREGPHDFLLALPPGTRHFDLIVAFSPDATSDALPDADEVLAASEAHWRAFWNGGGAIDLSGSTDPRSAELERRIVLSQYLTAIQCAGTMPPQETGLTFNSWHGKFHLEMHWWHAVHFALWDRLPMLERSLAWYRTILPHARETAAMQGYRGARWPKMVGPDGRESPSTIGVFLIWQQPHPIYYAELVYRAYPERSVLETYAEVVTETAAFMASFPYRDELGGSFVLGPPLIPAQELHPPRTTFNPTFELAYWRWGLETAQRWRERMGMPRDPAWQHVLENLSPLPMRDGLYVNAESDPETFHDPEKRRDHPTLLGAYGFVPSGDVGRAAMRRTLERVMDSWQWEETWGWDYPLVAMTAARLEAPEIAIDALLMDTPKNRHLPNGHNYQRPGLTIYLPGNGGLLAAVAMMAEGWDGGPSTRAPGFPGSGWSVRKERLRRMI